MATYAHELTHNLGIPDNYNNPFGTTSSVTATGMWDMMSRGSFNGPGGQHTRFLIPPTQGAALGSQHNMRNKRFLNFITDDDLLRLNRNGLASPAWPSPTSPRVRSRRPAARSPACSIALDGTGDNEAAVHATTTRPDAATAWPHGHRHDVTGKFNNYTMEVVQQIGSDSFDPGHGVLISKTKNSNSSCGSLQLLRLGHRLAPGGHQPGRLRRGRRHAEDGDASATSARSTTASFNAGLDSGSSYEYEDDGQPPALLHPRQAHRRAGHPALHGRRQLARRRRPADARRRARPRPQLGNAEGYATCTFTSRTRARRRRAGRHCTRRTPRRT